MWLDVGLARSVNSEHHARPASSSRCDNAATVTLAYPLPRSSGGVYTREMDDEQYVRRTTAAIETTSASRSQTVRSFAAVSRATMRAAPASRIASSMSAPTATIPRTAAPLPLLWFCRAGCSPRSCRRDGSPPRSKLQRPRVAAYVGRGTCVLACAGESITPATRAVDSGRAPVERQHGAHDLLEGDL